MPVPGRAISRKWAQKGIAIFRSFITRVIICMSAQVKLWLMKLKPKLEVRKLSWGGQEVT